MTDLREMEAVVEAILFVANEPVSRQKLLEVFAEGEREQAETALDAVLARYAEDRERGVMIDEAAGGLRLVSRPDLHGYLRRFFEVTGTNKLTMPALETLTIVAYRQPITAPEIQELRGVNASGVLKTLLERRLVRIAGRKEVVGKPFLYATTREFLMRFGLRSLKELPPLEDFDELVGGGDELADGGAEPDAEEEVLRETAELEEREDDAAVAAEAEAVEEERRAAVRAQEEAEMSAATPLADAGVLPAAARRVAARRVAARPVAARPVAARPAAEGEAAPANDDESAGEGPPDEAGTEDEPLAEEGGPPAADEPDAAELATAGAAGSEG